MSPTIHENKEVLEDSISEESEEDAEKMILQKKHQLEARRFEATVIDRLVHTKAEHGSIRGSSGPGPTGFVQI